MRKLEKQAQSEKVFELYQAILKLKNLGETSRFFRDLLTIEEIDEISRRWQVAQMLIKEIPYLEIEKETGMSSVTISRINYWLHHGMGGYKLMLSRLGLMKEK
ncbi:hypothetical protein A3F08_03440 [Candidatus Berkelbacteria bacterium RIFCSPHIGHO2_12_FULL_36_9]|uniref:TrpR, YerC/YecD n=1 Tax=Candidatus Berkelbacteria bacterium RIFCSPHIGHO2_12_FULL_36_9 TaxID=1797469 RepID=A0A1F5EHH8_9BACT|nr:MAG: hypothetical protein A3F08_03440 [Candidatus Berkelbacteria bacterium RIFCSPHIGHO2_12_FULL_36_9]